VAEEVLVKESISRDMISAGDRLARHLVASELPIDGLLWHYVTESNSWRFVVASPEVSASGPKNVYQRIRAIIEQMPQSDEQVVNWDDIFVVDTKDPLIKLLRQAVHTGKGVAGTRFSRNVVNGVLIEDAYVYKL
jgi:translation initiation factor 2 beta subunit (eIF-2beta)/eIF-5